MNKLVKISRAQAQQVAADVEKRLLDMMIEFEPAQGLTVSQIRTIAFSARNYAFDAIEREVGVQS